MRVQSSSALDADYQDEHGQNYQKFNGYTLFDVILTQKIATGELRYGIQNIADHQYVSYYSQTERAGNKSQQFAGLGRTWSLSYQIDF